MYCPWPRVLYKGQITFDSQFELGVEEETNKMLHLEHCSLWVREMEIRKTLK